METTGPRDRLVWEEMGRDCKGKVRYWLLSCYICVKRCEWSMLQLDSLWCSSKGCRRYFILCLSRYKVKNTHAYMPLIARKSDAVVRWACNSCVLFLLVPTAGPTAPGQGCEVVLAAPTPERGLHSWSRNHQLRAAQIPAALTTAMCCPSVFVKSPLLSFLN